MLTIEVSTMCDPRTVTVVTQFLWIFYVVLPGDFGVAAKT
jgi:hypothetical protein